MQLGNVIANFRNKKGIYQKDMADALDISVAYLSLVENNREKPSIKLLTAIAEYFEIPVSALLFAVLEERDFKKSSSRKSYLTAKPIVEQMINILISESTPTSKKKKTHRAKTV